MANTATESRPRVPTDVTTLKLLMIAVLEQSFPHMSTHRERTWVSQMVELLKTNNPQLKGGGGVKPTGIVRKVDELGRYVIPMELRRAYGLQSGDSVEISVDELSGMIVVMPYTQACHFCQGQDDVHEFKEKLICESCLAEAVNVL